MTLSSASAPKRPASPPPASARKFAPPPEPRAPLSYWFIGFLGLWVVLPLPFGANRPWSSDTMGVLCALLLLTMTVTLWRKQEAWQGAVPYKRLFTAAALIVGVVVWSWIQTVTWTPLTWHHPLWEEVAVFTRLAPQDGAISIDPSAFRETFARFGSYIGFFLLALFAGRDPARARLALRTFVGASVLYALYGLAMHLFGIERILWFPKPMYEGFITSTFVNKNSFATYTGLGFLASLALLWQQIKHRLHLEGAGFSGRTKILQLLLRFQKRDALYVGIVLLLFLTLILTGSRAGFFSTAAAALVFLGALIFNRTGFGWRSAAILILLLLTVGGVVTAAGNLIMARSEGLSPTLGEDAEMRLRAWSLAGDAVRDNPWLGFGLGSFESAFRLYRSDILPLRFQHAHNDYLEVAMEWGVPATAALLLALVLLTACCASGIRRRQRMEYFPALGLAASFLVGLHAFADFSMQIPAVAASYAVLLGLGVAQSWSARVKRSND